jgi:iron complex outermembrane recepter protein
MNRILADQTPKRLTAALLTIGAVTLGAQDGIAQNPVTAPTVVVTASRLDNGLTGASTTVITAEEIEKSPGRTIPEILSFEAGIRFQELFGSTNGAGQTIDIRGFGEPATANTLILINGRRLTDLDLAAVDFSSIPRDSIDRIEITRGNIGGVLYGGGAQGGVINIITKSNFQAGTHGSLTGGFGSDRFRETNFSATHNTGGYSVSAYGSQVESDGYRENNSLKQKNLTLEVRRRLTSGDVFVHVDLDDQKLGLPGGRLVDPSTGQNDLLNPRGAQTPNDFALENGIAAYVGGAFDLNDNAELVLDASVRRKDQDSDFRNQQQSRDTVLTTWGFTPRLLLDTTVANKKLTSTLGTDFYYVDYNSDRKSTPENPPFTRVKAYQYSTALYAQTALKVTPKLSTSFGFRVERIAFQAGDTAFPGNPGAFGFAQTSFRPTLSDTDLEYALNFGLEYDLTDTVTLYGHIGRSYRTPTLDERSGTAFALNTFELKNQSSKEIQGGTRFRIGDVRVDTRAFFSKTRDEIRFDPDGTTTFGANENIDPVHRYGLEGTASARLTDSISIKSNLTLLKAEFAAGQFDGKDVPLVPNIVASLGATWKITDWVSLNSVATYEGERRLANDEAGNFKRLADFTLWDIKLNGAYKALTWSASVNNLLDEDYQTFGTASDTTPGRFSVQTLPGRTYFFRLGLKM